MSTLPLRFRYTKNIGHLTIQQRIFYETNGYLLFPGLIPQDVIDKCHQRFDNIAQNKVSRDGITVMYDIKDRKSVSKLQEISYDPVFRLYIEHKNILDIVECITGPNILAIHNMLIAKPPDIGFGTTRHPPHQDLYYFPFRPAEHIVGVWTAMEPCDTQNGCLYIAPGTHVSERLYLHTYPLDSKGKVNKFYHGIHDLPLINNWLNLEMQPGDTVFFHPLIIHGSGINKSNRTRRAISCHYAAADCDIIKDDQMQDTIKNEILEHIKKKYPDISMTYADLWRFKSSLVRDLQSSF